MKLKFVWHCSKISLAGVAAVLSSGLVSNLQSINSEKPLFWYSVSAPSALKYIFPISFSIMFLWVQIFELVSQSQSLKNLEAFTSGPKTQSKKFVSCNGLSSQYFSNLFSYRVIICFFIGSAHCEYWINLVYAMRKHLGSKQIRKRVVRQMRRSTGTMWQFAASRIVSRSSNYFIHLSWSRFAPFLMLKRVFERSPTTKCESVKLDRAPLLGDS